MDHIAIGTAYRFDYPYDFEGDRMFRVRAADGWEADAWESELVPIGVKV